MSNSNLLVFLSSNTTWINDDKNSRDDFIKTDHDRYINHKFDYTSTFNYERNPASGTYTSISDEYLMNRKFKYDPYFKYEGDFKDKNSFNYETSFQYKTNFNYSSNFNFENKYVTPVNSPPSDSTNSSSTLPPIISSSNVPTSPSSSSSYTSSLPSLNSSTTNSHEKERELIRNFKLNLVNPASSSSSSSSPSFNFESNFNIENNFNFENNFNYDNIHEKENPLQEFDYNNKNEKILLNNFLYYNKFHHNKQFFNFISDELKQSNNNIKNEDNNDNNDNNNFIKDEKKLYQYLGENNTNDNKLNSEPIKLKRKNKINKEENSSSSSIDLNDIVVVEAIPYQDIKENIPYASASTIPSAPQADSSVSAPSAPLLVSEIEENIVEVISEKECMKFSENDKKDDISKSILDKSEEKQNEEDEEEEDEEEDFKFDVNDTALNYNYKNIIYEMENNLLPSFTRQNNNDLYDSIKNYYIKYYQKNYFKSFKTPTTTSSLSSLYYNSTEYKKLNDFYYPYLKYDNYYYLKELRKVEENIKSINIDNNISSIRSTSYRKFLNKIKILSTFYSPYRFNQLAEENFNFEYKNKLFYQINGEIIEEKQSKNNKLNKKLKKFNILKEIKLEELIFNDMIFILFNKFNFLINLYSPSSIHNLHQFLPTSSSITSARSYLLSYPISNYSSLALKKSSSSITFSSSNNIGNRSSYNYNNNLITFFNYLASNFFLLKPIDNFYYILPFYNLIFDFYYETTSFNYFYQLFKNYLSSPISFSVDSTSNLVNYSQISSVSSGFNPSYNPSYNPTYEFSTSTTSSSISTSSSTSSPFINIQIDSFFLLLTNFFLFYENNKTNLNFLYFNKTKLNFFHHLFLNNNFNLSNSKFFFKYLSDYIDYYSFWTTIFSNTTYTLEDKKTSHEKARNELSKDELSKKEIRILNNFEKLNYNTLNYKKNQQKYNEIKKEYLFLNLRENFFQLLYPIFSNLFVNSSDLTSVSSIKVDPPKPTKSKSFLSSIFSSSSKSSSKNNSSSASKSSSSSSSSSSSNENHQIWFSIFKYSDISLDLLSSLMIYFQEEIVFDLKDDDLNTILQVLIQNNFITDSIFKLYIMPYLEHNNDENNNKKNDSNENYNKSYKKIKNNNSKLNLINLNSNNDTFFHHFFIINQLNYEFILLLFPYIKVSSFLLLNKQNFNIFYQFLFNNINLLTKKNVFLLFLPYLSNKKLLSNYNFFYYNGKNLYQILYDKIDQIDFEILDLLLTVDQNKAKHLIQYKKTRKTT